MKTALIFFRAPESKFVGEYYSDVIESMNGGGFAIHFNIMNADVLRDAQKNPEKYKNLQVRVCGWNTLWNNMAKSEQEAYILRAENII